MDPLMELTIYVGRLEQRLHELEEKINSGLCCAPFTGSGETEPAEPEEDGKKSPDKLLQEGIDNIMGYQWPPAREGDDG